ncbi:Uncharacterised protein [Burkholderia pseudomallei]|nr:Uncharacterised protein [Burkholderia pseudomallei]CAJ4321729.1 Uncharacterised protein [Burkholderia pseudomallei]CAJ8496200.1 Uncharacterised protein [Burkholderia pseudomallei]CAJ9488876.1 Uncharacterised protein [Burkholderia pseudomallei]
MAALGADRQVARVRIVQIVEARRAKRARVARRYRPVLGDVKAIAEIVAVRAAEIGVLVAAHVRLEPAVADAAGIAEPAGIHVPLGRRILVRFERLVEPLVPRLDLVAARDREIVLPCVLAVVGVEVIGVRAVQRRLVAILAARHAHARRPPVGERAVRERGQLLNAAVQIIQIGRRAVRVVIAVPAVRLEVRDARVPLVAERVPQRRGCALVQIAVRVRIRLRLARGIERREAVGLQPRERHAERRPAVRIEPARCARALRLRVIAAVARGKIEARRVIAAVLREHLHDAADRARAVQRRHVAVHHFDALDLIERQLGDLRLPEARRIDAHAVDQHERLRRLRAAQEKARARARPAVAHDLRAGREREQAGQIGRAAVGDVARIEERRLWNRVGEPLRPAPRGDDDRRELRGGRRARRRCRRRPGGDGGCRVCGDCLGPPRRPGRRRCRRGCRSR